MVTPEGLRAMAGFDANPPVTVVARRGSGRGELRYFTGGWPEEPHHRIPVTLPYLEYLCRLACDSGIALRDDEQIIFQLEDNPLDVPSVAWQARAGWHQVRLIPDLYYFMANGYEGFDPEAGRWEDRRPSLIWRGSSTGLQWQTLSIFEELPRYRLCKLAGRLGAGADIGLTEICQAANAQEEQLILDRVSEEGLLKTYVPMADMARHRFIVDIDGNANSWNFMQKLRLGCCVLRVDSDWRQWFSDRLIAWEHYVPIAADLSDFIERAEWCFANPAECSAIASRGKQFAVSMNFAEEMSCAAFTTFASPAAAAEPLAAALRI